MPSTYFSLEDQLLLSGRGRGNQCAGCVHNRLCCFENLFVKIEIFIDGLDKQGIAWINAHRSVLLLVGARRLASRSRRGGQLCRCE